MEVVWAAGLRDSVRAELIRRAPAEHGGALLARVDRRGEDTRFLVVGLEIPPAGEVVADGEDALRIEATFWARVAKRGRRERLAVLPVHTHPIGHGVPRFSVTDRAGEQRLLPVLANLTGLPTAAVVMGPGGEAAEGWEGDEAGNGGIQPGRCRDIGEGPDLAGGIVSGQDAVTCLGSTAQPGAPEDDVRFARHIRAFGTQGQRRLAALTVGVVGASGTGSHVCEQLIRLGVGRLVVVDPDQVELVNLNRIVTAFAEDAAKHESKVQAVAAYARRVEGPTVVETLPRSVLDAAAARPLAAADALFGCTDTLASRAVLNRLAIQHYIPYWDCGTEIASGGRVGELRAYGRVRFVLAGGPCLVCLGVVDPAALRAELLPPVERERERGLGYIRDAEVAAPAVVSLNGIAASLAVMHFLRWAVGEQPLVPGQWVYRTFAGDVRPQAGDRQPNCPVCSPTARLGRADLDPTL